MPTISDYLLQTTSTGVTSPRVGAWVRFTNNVTSAQFVSVAPTDSNGNYTLTNIPSGIYTIASGPSNIGPFTNTGDANYLIGADVGSANTFTALLTALAGIQGTGGASGTLQTLVGALEVLNASGNGIFQVDLDNSVQFASTQLRLRHTANALPNAGHEVWMLFSDRTATGGTASNTRLILTRANPNLTIRQDYLTVDTAGVFHVGDSGVFSTGSPNPGLGAVQLGKYASGVPGVAPTLGALQTNITAQSLGAGSNDQRGFVSITTGATPPAAGATVLLLNFGNGVAWPVTPTAIVSDSTGGGANGTGVWSAQATTTVLTLFAGIGLTASKQYTISYWAIG